MVKRNLWGLSALSFLSTTVCVFLVKKKYREEATVISILGWLAGIIARAGELHFTTVDVAKKQERIDQISQSHQLDNIVVLDNYPSLRPNLLNIAFAVECLVLVAFGVFRTKENHSDDDETELDELFAGGGLLLAFISLCLGQYYKSYVQGPAKKTYRGYYYFDRVKEELEGSAIEHHPKLMHDTLISLLWKSAQTTISETFGDFNELLTRLSEVLNFGIDSYSHAEVEQHLNDANQFFIAAKALEPKVEKLQQLVKEIILPKLEEQVRNGVLSADQDLIVSDCRTYHDGGEYIEIDLDGHDNAMPKALASITNFIYCFKQSNTFYSKIKKWSKALEIEMQKIAVLDQQLAMPEVEKSEKQIGLEEEQARLLAELEQLRKSSNDRTALVGQQDEIDANTRRVDKLVVDIGREAQTHTDLNAEKRQQLQAAKAESVDTVNEKLSEAKERCGSLKIASDHIAACFGQLSEVDNPQLVATVKQMLSATGHIKDSHQPEEEFTLTDWRNTLSLVR